MNQLQDEGYRWVILGTLFSLHVLTSAGQFSIPPVLPFIKEDLGLNYTQVGLFTSSSYLGSALTATFAGWTVDSLGIKKMVVLGTILMGTCMLIASWMPSFLWVLIFLFLSGISYSILIPSTNKAAMVWFHQRLRATAIGIKQTGINGGGFVAAFSIPPLAMNFGWRLAFSVAGFFVLLGGIVMLIFYREFDPESYHQAPLREWKYQIKQVISNRNVLILGFEGFFRIGIQSVFLTYLILYKVCQKTPGF
jgi:MFS family permease